jgi:hypothetical protein
MEDGVEGLSPRGEASLRGSGSQPPKDLPAARLPQGRPGSGAMARSQKLAGVGQGRLG